MHKFTVALLIFLTGWMLSRVTYDYLDSERSKSVSHTNYTPLVQQQTPRSDSTIKTTPERDDNVAAYLQKNDFETAVNRYELLKDKTDSTMAESVRMQILGHTRQLIEAHRFMLAEQLLKRYLLAAYRDVEAHMLLAEVYYGRENYMVAIDKLYEARSLAVDPAMLQGINSKIRSLVAALTTKLEATGDNDALLAMYQQLTLLEADHAPWFIGLADAQLALDDLEAARRSLLLVAHDAGVGAKARNMLAALAISLPDAPAAKQGAMTKLSGIPLIRHGSHFIVDASQGRGNNIRLLIDTGATMTIIKPEVLAQIRLSYFDNGKTAVFDTANGQVHAPVYTLDFLAVGDWQVNHLDVGILDISSGADFDGLLGMNFLKYFQFYIDQNDALLRLSSN